MTNDLPPTHLSQSAMQWRIAWRSAYAVALFACRHDSMATAVRAAFQRASASGRLLAPARVARLIRGRAEWTRP